MNWKEIVHILRTHEGGWMRMAKCDTRHVKGIGRVKIPFFMRNVKYERYEEHLLRYEFVC